MTIEFMKELFNKVTKQREEMLPRYLEIMNKYFPEKMISPYERFKRDGGYFKIPKLCENYTEKDWQEEWKEYYKNHYNDDYRDPEDSSFYNCFGYEKIYDKKHRIPEADFIRSFSEVMSTYAICKKFFANPENSNYRDSDSLYFENEDVLITDPCYIIKECGEDDWRKCGYGSNFKVFGIHKYDTRDTLYGDWSCTVWNKDTKEKIGEFCADAGMVSIFSLDEVRAYNPDIEKWCAEHKWCATIIRNFTGKVQIKVGFNEVKDEKNEDIFFYDFYCYVEGDGSVNFYGAQTGL